MTLPNVVIMSSITSDNVSPCIHSRIVTIANLFALTITKYPSIHLFVYIFYLSFLAFNIHMYKECHPTQRKTPLDFVSIEALAQRYSREHGSPLKHVSVAVNGPLGIHSSHYL